MSDEDLVTIKDGLFDSESDQGMKVMKPGDLPASLDMPVASCFQQYPCQPNLFES